MDATRQFDLRASHADNLRVAKSVIGLGQAALELYGLVDRYPQPDASLELREFSMQSGGLMVTALATLATLGESTALSAVLSDDDFGRFVLDGLRQLGVDVSRVAVQSGRVSPLAFVVVDQETHGRVQFQMNGSIDLLSASAIDTSWISQARALLVDGRAVAAQTRACEIARASGITVLLSANVLSEGFGELVGLADVLIASERVASEIAPRGEVQDSLAEISQMGPHTVVVTLGAQGAAAWEGDKFVEAPALEVDVVDRSGAGGVFRGAYVYAHLQGWPLEKCLRFANVAAALKCRSLGSCAGLPTLDSITRAAWG